MVEVKLGASLPRSTPLQRANEAETAVFYDRWIPANLSLDMALAGMTSTGDLLHALGTHFDQPVHDEDTLLGRFRRIVDAAIEDAIRDAPPLPAATLHEMALWYARELHWPVFPLAPDKKTPYPGSNGFEDATTDPGQIHHWWTVAPDSNIGIATGHGIDALDFDGPGGLAQMLTWRAQNLLPPTIAQTVTGQGWQLWIPSVAGRHNTTNLPGQRRTGEPGVDTRALGGYVVAPPSIHPRGMRYTWRQGPYQTEPAFPTPRPINTAQPVPSTSAAAA